MTMKTKIAGLAAGMALALPALAIAPAHAEERAACGCAQPLPTDGTPIGAVVSASDDVLMSFPQGMAPAKAGAPLVVGSRLIAGPAGSAMITVGRGCDLAVAAGSTVAIAAQEGSICVRTASVAREPQATSFSSASGFGQQGPNGGASSVQNGNPSPQVIPGVPNTLLAGAVGVGAIGGVVAIVASNDDNDGGSAPSVSAGQ
ncbi:hypothetical protein VQ042_23200 [Aurantimonas sp. A2-1-M11]|uniref:hypothetical protein n=1 Tax=Aurantimonas sp. A2-1-M11 TaxID=3113712 RepID=UPI002F920FA8